MTDTVLREHAGAVATITLNRPAARNALTVETKLALLETLRECGADAGTRAVILTGAGPGFCAGEDLAEHAGRLEDAGRDGDASALGTVREHYNPIIEAIAGMPKPVIAAVNGVAAGAGAGIALACDFRIAARRASILIAFARVGLGADSGVSWTLSRLAGPARAAELLMLAEPVDAERALGLGLLTSVVDDTELNRAAASLAARLADGPTLAYAAIKQSLLYSGAHGLRASLAHEADQQEALGQTRDHRAATAAFLAKQVPVFLGREPEADE